MTDRLSRRSVLAGASGLALAAPAVAQAAELTVWSGYPEMEPFYRRVGESMGGRVAVRVQAIPLREHERRIALALPSGGAADVIEMQNSTAQRYIDAQLLAEAPGPVAAFVRDGAKFDPFLARSATSDGAVYGVPNFRGQCVLFYDTAMLEAAGLSAPPATMPEYSAAAERLTQRDPSGRPTVTGWSLRLSGGGQGIAEKFWINLHQYGGAVVREVQPGKWLPAYANEAGRATLAQILDAVFVRKTCPVDAPADADAFERRQTAMFIRESWVVGDIAQKAPGLRYATAPLPVGTIVAPVFYYTPAKGPHTEAAWAFATAANEPANQQWLLDNVGWLPNRRDVDYAAITAKTPQFAAFVNAPADRTYFALPAIGPSDEVLTRLAARLERAYGNASLAGNTAAIDAALREASAETETILRREDLLAKG